MAASLTRHLGEYGEKERAQGEAIADDLLNSDHTIRQARALYPEWSLKPPFGLHRPGVSVAALLLLYRQAIVYVPPMRRRDFKVRFGVPYDTFMALAYPGGSAAPFLFPVLNHPAKYRNPLHQHELRDLLVKMPPTWERWHQALEITGGKRWFALADEKFDYAAIARLPQLRKVWKRRLKTESERTLSREIKQQVRNNYTDLCLIGKQEDADRIARLSHEEPEHAAVELFWASDFFAYPTVMGAGAIANVRLPRRPPAFAMDALRREANIQPEEYDTDVLETMFLGLRIHDIDAAATPDFLLEWHEKGQAEVARRAYESLLGAARGSLLTQDDFRRKLKDVIRELQAFKRSGEQKVVRRLDAVQRVAARVSFVGGLATGGAGLIVSDPLWTYLGGGFTLLGGVTWSKNRHLLGYLLRQYIPEVPAEFYMHYTRIEDFVHAFMKASHKVAAERPVSRVGVPSTDTTVRTIFWED